MTDLTTMRNIGNEMASKLKSVDINSAEELTIIGSKLVFFMLKAKYPQVGLAELYCLEGAIQDVDIENLSESTKNNLKKFIFRFS